MPCQPKKWLSYGLRHLQQLAWKNLDERSPLFCLWPPEEMNDFEEKKVGRNMNIFFN